MKTNDLKFEVLRVRPANEKHPAAAFVKVNCESKKILKLAILKGNLVIFYEEKR